jgi:hypothetical protein
MNAQLSFVAAAIACGALVACGSSSSGESPTSPVPDAGAGHDAAPEAAAAEDSGPPRDPGAPSTTYPAFKPDFGQIVDNGGLVLKSPTVVAITWDSDPSQASFDQFADTIGETAYWQATCSEYGVGQAACGAVNHVHIKTAAPAMMTDQDLQNLVSANAKGGPAAAPIAVSDAGADDAGGDGAAETDAQADAAPPVPWPAASTSTIYAFFLPPGVSLQTMTRGGTGDACSAGIGGYHSQVTVGSVTTSYAVVPSCTFGTGNTAAQQTTMSMSHELIEAVTDPHPMDNSPGYVGFDNAHFAFDYFQEFSSEVGDACEFFQSSFFEDKETSPVAFDYWVQRTWSNKAGPLGHDPCQPAPSTPYFNVTPLNLEMVTITLSAQLTGGAAMNVQTKGLHIPVGMSGTLELGFYSDGPTAPWNLTYTLGSPVSSTKPTYLTVSLDKSSGQNGEKAYATITATSKGKLGGELLVFESSMNGMIHVMPVLIGSE